MQDPPPVGDEVSREQGRTMTKATMTQVKEFFSVPGKLVKMAEIQELSKEERDELALLVGAELEKGDEGADAA